MEQLRSWQSNRLAGTYADIQDDKRFESGCKFFLSDIYAARDFTQRDEDVNRIHGVLSKVLPPSTLRLLNEAVQLTRLSNDLDLHLLEALDSLGAEEITQENYAEAYRTCDNYDLRIEQIERICHLLKLVIDGSKLPLVGSAVRLARGPALRAGYDSLYDFVTRGYAAFVHMHSPQIFVNTIHKRETGILDNIYQSRENPFDFIRD